jgi:MerR family mercuric resistance operon transcriptional regulator
MHRFTIGRLANSAGVTVETIRYYERRGLLARPPRSGGQGYREYSERDLAIMQHIKLGKELGLQLSEIRRLLDLLGSEQRFCDEFQELLRKKLSFVQREQERLRRIEGELGRTLSACAARGSHDDCPIQQRLAISDFKSPQVSKPIEN